VVWTIFWINVLTIAVAFKKRMILYALVNTVFLYLVTGQAFQIQGDLETGRTVYYLFNFINDVGFGLALWYVLGVSFVSLLLAVVSRGYRRNSQPKQLYSFAPGRRFYLCLFLYLSVVSFLLIFVLIGVSEFLQSGRPGVQTGTTIFLVLLFVGVLPLLLKVICGDRIMRGDLACCLLSILVIGWFSRIVLIFCLVAIFLALYHSRGWIDAPLRPWLVVRFLAFGGAVAILFIGVGALHDAQNFTQGSLGDLFEFILEHPEKSVVSVEYNYRVGIEGMSGIAGAFTQYLSEPNSVHWDYGLSWLLIGSTQWMPGFLKTHFEGIIELGLSRNWYPYSIVAAGVETFFMSFGWSAILLYPLALYLLAWRLPLKVLQSPRLPSFRLISYVVMACVIFFVRGPLQAWIAFTFSYGLTAVAVWPMFRRYVKLRDHLRLGSSPAW
jgi:hypothetical protein